MRRLLLNVSLSLIIFFLSACGVPLKIKHSKEDDCLIFDIQKWGEYATMIELIELIDTQENSVIWSAQPQPGKFARIAYIKLCQGANPIIPKMNGDADALQCSTINNSDSFTLMSGRDYQLKVFSPEHRQPGKTIFSFPDK